MKNFLNKIWKNLMQILKIKRKPMEPKKLKEETASLENLTSEEKLTNSGLIQKLFEESDVITQWSFLHEYKENGHFILDNDHTCFRIIIDDSFNDEEGVFDLDLTNYLGQDQGLCDLLDSLGFKYERA